MRFVDLFRQFTNYSIYSYRLIVQKIKFFLLLFLVIALYGVQLSGVNAQIFDSSRIGISNDNLRTKGDEIFGATNEQASLEKLKQQLEATKVEIANQICDQAPTDKLCSVLPNDNPDFSELFVYMFINAAAQNSFDVFSWQSFIGLNWPLNSNGEPSQSEIGKLTNNARVWTQFKTPRQIYAPEHQDEICDVVNDDQEPYLITSNYLQTGGKPLIDKNLNFVVYDIRVNPEMEKYILENGLNTIEGQFAFKGSGREIDFPVGYYSDPKTKTGGAHGSIALKTAWKIIDSEAGDDPDRYFTINGRIPITVKHSETGNPFCIKTKLGLVGMHIMRRTESGHGRNWIWSTFEHVDNSPVATNSRKPVDTLQKVLFDDGCQAPEKDQVDRSFAFFNPDCIDCTTNVIEQAVWKWRETRPYAKNHAVNGKFGTQVVRCWKTFAGTEVINGVWQKKLAGTVWANYQLFSAQWKGANPSPMFPEGEVPRFLTNTTMETYDQYSEEASCLSCHKSAKTLASQDSKFSFLLSLVAKYANSAANQTASN